VVLPIDGEDSAADFRRLHAAPAAAQATYFRSLGTNNAPCSWLDTATKRCLYYDFRPDICRTFEVGGKWCSQFRKLYQIG
jgi:Fe-S-cluster containining protein